MPHVDTSKLSQADKAAYEASLKADRAARRGKGEREDAYATALAWDALSDAHSKRRRK